MIQHFQTLSNYAMDNFWYPLYFVGWMVRDSLISWKEINLSDDIDITWALTPDEYIELMDKFVWKENHSSTITEKVGTVFSKFTYQWNTYSVEYTPFRSESNYNQSTRKPDNIRFSRSIHDDFIRRDFTINALYYSLSENKIIDLSTGIPDIKNKIIRAVWNPTERFKEDYLRIFRAIRFSAKFYFIIDKETYKAMLDNYTLLNNASTERIAEEFYKWDIADSNTYRDLLHFYWKSIPDNGSLSLDFSCIKRWVSLIPQILKFTKDYHISMKVWKFLMKKFWLQENPWFYYKFAYDYYHKDFDKIDSVDKMQEILYYKQWYHHNIDQWIEIFKCIEELYWNSELIKYAKIIKRKQLVIRDSDLDDWIRKIIWERIQNDIKKNRNIKSIIYNEFIKNKSISK